MELYYILIYFAIGFIPAKHMAYITALDFEKKHPEGTYNVRFKSIDGLVIRTVYGLAFMIALLITPLTLIDYIVDKTKGREKKWQNLKQHGFTKKRL